MAQRFGTRELGIRVTWSYGFVGHGSTAASTPGTVYVDVGNRLCPGVLDQHHDATVGDCTSEVLVSHPEHAYHHLLGDVLQRHAFGDLPEGTHLHLRIVSHRDPDWDVIVTAFLIQRLITDGEFPDYTPGLVDYARTVDQGRFSVRRYLAAGEVGRRALSRLPHLGALVMPHVFPRNDEANLVAGLELLQATVDGLRANVASEGPPHRWTAETFETLTPERANGEPSEYRSAPGAWADLDRFRSFPDLILNDMVQWRADTIDAIREDVLLPVDDGDGNVLLRPVPAIILRRCSQAMLNKYWARAERTPLFVCPYGDAKDPLAEGDVAPRVIISLPDDPGSWPEGVAPAHLRGLAASLELEETRLRARTNRARVGRPRWNDTVYCDNADPWYDGRSHGYRIIDPPHAGTVLPYATILAHLRNARAWAPLDVLVEDVAVDLHVMLPTDTALLRGVPPAPRADGGAEVPAGLSSTLRTWIAHTRRADVMRRLTQEIPPPPGVVITRAHVRDLLPVGPSTIHIFPRMLHVAIRRDPTAAEPPRLGEIADWITSLEHRLHGRSLPSAPAEAMPDRIFLKLAFSRTRTVHDYERALERLRRRLGATTQRLDGSYVGPRALLGEHPSDPLKRTDSMKEHETFSEALAYVAFVDATLSSVSEHIASAVLTMEGAATRKRINASELRNEFLLFQGLYYQPEVSSSPRVQSACDDVREALRVTHHYHEVESEIDRLAAVEATRTGEHMSTAMHVLALVSVVETMDVLAQGVLALAPGNDSTPAFPWLRLVVSVGTIATLSLWWLRFRPRT